MPGRKYFIAKIPNDILKNHYSRDSETLDVHPVFVLVYYVTSIRLSYKYSAQGDYIMTIRCKNIGGWGLFYIRNATEKFQLFTVRFSSKM